MKKFVNELYEYELRGKIKIEQSGDEKEIPTMVIDEDQDSIEEKTKEKMKDVSKPLVSYEISDEKEKRLQYNLIEKQNSEKNLNNCLSNFYKYCKIWSVKIG